MWSEKLEAELEAVESDKKPNYLAIVMSGVSGAAYAFVLWLALQAHERKAAREMYGQSERSYVCKRTILTGLSGGATMLAMLYVYTLDSANVWWIVGGSIGSVVALVVLRWLWEG